MNKPSSEVVDLVGCVDFDYAGYIDSLKSTFGYFLKYKHKVISRGSKLQKCTTLLIIEGEYIAASDEAKEVIWLQRLAADFTDSGSESHTTLILFYDSQSTIYLTRNLVFHAKTKHIKVWYHHIHELITEKRLEI